MGMNTAIKNFQIVVSKYADQPTAKDSAKLLAELKK